MNATEMERLEDELAPRQERREPRPAWMREERRHERADAKRDNVAEVIKAEGSVLGTRLG